MNNRGFPLVFLKLTIEYIDGTIQTFETDSISPKGEKILDFGQNASGFVRFKANLKKGQTVTLYHGEILQDTGRFDFSTGAVMLISGVVGAKIAYQLNLGPVGMMFIAAVTGLVVGVIVGLLYILLKLPPMIIGLGMSLVLEGLVAIISDGCKPVRFGADTSYYSFSVNQIALLVLMAIGLVVMIER